MLWYGTEPLVPDNPTRAIELALQSKIPLLLQYTIRRAAAQNETLPAVVAALGKTTDPEMQRLILEQMMSSEEGELS